MRGRNLSTMKIFSQKWENKEWTHLEFRKKQKNSNRNGSINAVGRSTYELY